jgi:AcrR family transcriptional regulator
VAGQQQRAQQILDATADLVLRWGYKRVTVEEVAKHAGVGKGTVYLHFESRAQLFLCVLMRETLGLVDELAAAIRRDAAAVLLSEQVRLTFLGVRRRPLLHAMFARDREVLGELAHAGSAGPLHEWRSELAAEQFRLLRDHRLIRTDLDVDTQLYVVGAVQTGFYLHRAGPESGEADPETAAFALRHAVRAALEPPGTPDPDVLAAVAPAVLASYQRFRTAMAAAVTGRTSTR